MQKIFSAIESLAKREAKNPVVVRTIHTAWQAALGAGVAAISGTHGDVKAAVLVAVAAAAAAIKSAVVAAAEGKAAPVPAPVVAPAPAVDVTVVSTPSTPAS